MGVPFFVESEFPGTVFQSSNLVVSLVVVSVHLVVDNSFIGSPKDPLAKDFVLVLLVHSEVEFNRPH